MIIAHHIIWTAYGWWLPNDPRGSTSNVVRCSVLKELGELHRGRKKVQPASRDLRAFYAEAGERLSHPLLTLNTAEIENVGEALGTAIQAARYTCYACAVLDDHVHILIRKHRDDALEMMVRLQDASRELLRRRGHRAVVHPVWSAGGWIVYQDDPDDIRRTIRCINDNPLKIRLPAQSWAFVTPYDGWPLHKGHSSNSPYVRRPKGEPFGYW